MAEPYDVIVIGGGPAGLSAALVLGRCVRRALVCDSGRYRNERSQAMHCYLGLDGIRPADLLATARKQLESYDTVTLTPTRIASLSRVGKMFAARTEAGETHLARMLLVATGVVDELPKIEGILDFFGTSVHVCPYCDGWECRDAPVAVFGPGDKGAGLALMLRQWTDDLVVCTHGAEVSDEERAMLAKRGILLREVPIVRLEGAGGCLESVVFADGTKLARKALFFNTGQHPRSTLLESLGCRYGEKGVECDENGETSIPGVYVAGDVSRDVQLVTIAAAEGARSAIAINRALLKADGHM